jgi:hypothetical protein
MFFDAVLFGVLAVQIVHWRTWASSERRFTKIIVVRLAQYLIIHLLPRSR